jgi:ABC-type branched-subunit amino acid transport system permease subunit
MSSADDFGWQQPQQAAQSGPKTRRGETLPTLLAIVWSIAVLVVMMLSAFGAISGACTFRLTLVLLAIFAAGFALKSVRDEHRSRAARSRRANSRRW